MPPIVARDDDQAANEEQKPGEIDERRMDVFSDLKIDHFRQGHGDENWTENGGYAASERLHGNLADWLSFHILGPFWRRQFSRRTSVIPASATA